MPITLCLALYWLLEWPLRSNETQRIAIVKKFVDSTWIPNDWFLNAPAFYQLPFTLLASPFVALLDMGVATVLLRLLLYGWFASGIVALARRLDIGLVALIPAVFLATAHGTRFLAAMEWMVGSAEGKVVAYGAILWAFSFLIGRRYPAAAALLGLAMTFHVLVGLYATLTSLLFLLAHPRHRRSFMRSLPAALPIFLITGGFGIYTVVHNLMTRGESDPFTDLIYIARNAHHVWPPAWSNHRHISLPAWVDGFAWVVKAAMSVSFLTLVAVRCRVQRFREFAQLVLSSTPFFAMGIFFYAVGPIGFLKYYPFRFPDVLLPFASFLLFFGVWERMANSQNLYRPSPWIRNTLRIGLVAAVGIAFVAVTYKFTSDLQVKRRADVPWAFVGLTAEEIEVTRWIRDNTPADAIFLSDPGSDTFYVTAERGMLVTFKNIGSNEATVREWNERLVAINRGRAILLDPPGIAFEQIRDSFNSLSLEDARSLATRYDLDYYHGTFREEWDLPPIFRSGNRAVYRLR
jgi:hypothetical protein